jgi:hypothetical protein
MRVVVADASLMASLAAELLAEAILSIDPLNHTTQDSYT